ncbi:uncharacterized protein LOC113558870 [Rhopalosiphum maidis]|uniref:uncharacterized protein LOC113558870 n=1 Tax=Rhopalosiphum maidis TaxID=43146 RepID=UPI000F003C1E|nr:uncharacterized protein LOC113558870 [Rhopalosiphum maidis]
MIMLIILTYSLFINTSFIQSLQLLKLWTIIIASRISEIQLIKLINGITEYDQKLTSFPRYLLIHRLLPKKNYWNTIFMFTLIYYILITILFMNIWPPKSIDMISIAVYFIRLEFITDVSLTLSSYFFLQQLEYRFEMLNYSWKYLFPEFLTAPGEFTHSITGMTLDKIRLLHTELSDLLRIFSEGYGKILLGYFVFNYIDMLLGFYYSIIFTKNIKIYHFHNFIRKCVPYIFQLQNSILVLSIIIAASRVREKKRKMISHLRLIRISNLSANLKIQIKLFMNQISVLESSEITAFGIFNINLNLVVSIITLLITGLVTIIQMKQHPIMSKIEENINTFLQNISVGNTTY